MSVLVHGEQRGQRGSHGQRRVLAEPLPESRTTHRIPPRHRGETRRPPTRARALAGHARPAAPAPCAPSRSRALRWPLLLALAVGSALLVLTIGLLAGGVAQRAAPVPEQTTLVSVGQGETLTELARRYAPDSDTGAVVGRIRQLNDLGNAAVPAGLPLAVPYQPGLAPAGP